MPDQSFLNSQLFAVLVTAAIFVIGGVVQYYREKRNELRAEHANLWMARNEVTFYFERCQHLSKVLDNQIAGLTYQERVMGPNAVVAGPQIREVPTFNFHPELLGDLRGQLARLLRDPSVVAKIGNMHYKLSLIKERIHELKAEVKNLPKVPGSLKLLNDKYKVIFLILEIELPKFKELASELEDLVLEKKRDLFAFDQL